MRQTSRRAMLFGAAGVGGAALAQLPSGAQAAATGTSVPPGTTATVTASSGVVLLDPTTADTFLVTLATGGVVFTFGDWPATTSAGRPVTTTLTVIVTQDATGGRTFTLPNVTWLPQGSAPVFDTGPGQVDVITLISPDGGATIYGQAGPTGGGFGVYGDGSDGAAVLDGTNTYSFLGKSGHSYWLKRDVFLTSLSIAPNCSLQLGGGGTPTYRLYATGTVGIAAAGTITTIVNHPASGSTGGSNLATGPLAPGASSPGGTTGAGAAGTNVLGAIGTGTVAGGAGGAASGGTSGGGAGGTATLPAGVSLPRQLPAAATMSAYGPNVSGTTQFFPGGASGGAGQGDGTNAGGAGGPGGNPVFIAARTVANSGSITAVGGDGGAAAGGNAGGGGGGQGGPVMVICERFVAGSGSTVASVGGAGGARMGTGAAGQAGGPSWTIVLTN